VKKLEYFNPHSNQWLLNKFEVYKAFRTSETAYWSERYQLYVISRYEDILFALTNPDIFSSAKGNLIVEHTKRFGKTLGASDDPTHSQLKNTVKNAYSKDNTERVVTLFREKAEKYLSNNNTLNISDVVEHLSAWTIAEMLNYPFDKTVIKNLIVEIQRRAPLAVGAKGDDSYESGYMRLFNFEPATPYGISHFLANIAKCPAHGPGIYKEYFDNRGSSGLDFDPRSLLSGPTLSGASSLTGALQFLTLDLYRENQLDILLSDPTLISKAVDESLRFHASTGRFSRTVTQDVTLHGIDLKPGTRVALCLESGNRDPDKFPDPEKFDIHRDTSGSLAFGRGPHACIALAITKAVMEVYLEILLKHFGKYTVLTKNDDLKYVITDSGNDDMITNIMIESGK
jgi:cytochrome P450